MARITLTMEETLWSRARDAASVRGQSLSRFVVESLVLHLDRSPPDSEIGQGAVAPPERSTGANEIASDDASET